MSDNVLSLHEVRKTFGVRVVLDGVTFGLDAGDKVGLVGPNGAGKSTLLRLIAGHDAPDEGEIAMRSGLSVAFLEQVPPLRPGATVRQILSEPLAPLLDAIADYEAAVAAVDEAAEELLARIELLGGWDHEHRLRRAIATVGLADLEAPVDPMSGGERKRVALARMLLCEPDLVLLDEPTNHLDAETIEWLEGWIDETAAACLLVTHDRYFLDRTVDRMADLAQGQLRFYDGGYTDYLAARAVDEELRGRLEARRLNLLKTELAWALRSPKARTRKSKARLARVDETRREVAGLKESLASVEMRFGRPPRLGKTILELVDLRHAYDGGEPLLAGLSLVVRRGERFGVIGANGCGKTTLLRLVLGELAPDGGRVVVGKNTTVAYLDQHRSILDPLATVREMVTPEGGDFVFPGGDKVHVATWLRRFAFERESHGMRVERLSGGERNRLALARLLLEPANLLLLDEPTNDLDLATLQVLEEALVAFAGCVIVVTHDRYFLDKVATAIIAFEAGEGGEASLRVQQGDYSHYRDIALAEAARARHAMDDGASGRGRPAATPSRDRRAPRARKPLTYSEELELPELEPRIEAAEAELARLEALLAAPETWAGGPDRGLAVQGERDAARREAERLFARWEELMTRLEEG